ncbi:ABC transporter ATP-binding protein [Microbacterium sp. G2-8]|uniref:ATP-binding cassette domain-containing protein n=1 Tax=Microbacterium sp. G2-8 TaxID=2842454 RepID=UPI001C89989E|nr:ABC transporter ATP-binding protein [Microbacterium sp. G2-8]
MTSLLSLRDLRVDLPGTGRVLDDVSIDVRAGEILGVVGASGAGKSVLARTLLGLTQDDPSARVAAERFTFDGRDLRRTPRRTWRRLRGAQIGLVLQDALQSLDPLRTVEAEVGETLRIQRVPRRDRRERILAALEQAGLPHAAGHLRQRSGDLSGGMRQRVLIASAIVGGTRLIVADEPTTALDATTAVHVLDLLGRLRDDGAAIVLITHDIHAVRRAADRLAVLDRGRIVEQGTMGDVLGTPAHAVTRSLVAAVPSGPKPAPRRESLAAPDDAHRPPAELVAAVRVTKRYRDVTAVDGVDLALSPGETLGVVGESGSGKTTLARILIGAESPDEGTVERADRTMRLVPQDPLGSFDPRHTVERILRTARRGDAPEPVELLRRVGLDAALLLRRPARLSGGQRQRVAIARALAARPDVLVCDEPVSALDVTTQAGILDLLLTLQRDEGLAMVFISHDLAVVRRVSDRLLVMQAGRVVDRGATEDVYARPASAFTRDLIAASGA